MDQVAPASPLHYPLDPPPAGGQLRLAESLRWLRLPIPGGLDHINLWLLEDADGDTLVDTGMDTPPTRAAWERLLAEIDAPRRLKRILVTHHHPDHLGLAHWLAGRFGTEVWMSAQARAAGEFAWHGADAAQRARIEAFYRAHGLDDPASAVEFAAGQRTPKLLSGMPRVDRMLHDGELLALGGRDWRVLLVGGHAAGQVTLYDEQRGTLISGDQVLPRISANVSLLPLEPDADPLGVFRASLQRLRACGDPLVLPSHGGVFQGLQARIAELNAHHEQALQRVFDWCRAPLAAVQVRELLYPRRLDSFHAVLALGETLAHLNHLWTRGELRRQCEAGLIRFQRA